MIAAFASTAPRAGAARPVLSRMASTGLDVFTMAYLAVVTNCAYLAFNGFEMDGPTSKSGDKPLYQLVCAVLYIALAARLAVHRREAVETLVRRPAFLCLMIAGTTSYLLVGVNPQSLLRAVMYVLTLLFGLDLYLRCGTDRMFRHIFVLAVVVTIAHLGLYPVLSTRLAYDNIVRNGLLGVPAYAGLFSHKNIAASFFAVTLIVTACQLAQAPPGKRRVWYGAAFGLQLVSLLLSGATAPVFGLVFAFVCVSLLNVLRHRQALGLSLLLIGAGCAVLALGVVGLDGMLAGFGRDADFTGRDFLFQMWPRFFWQHPLFGFGFNGFFYESPDAPVAELTALAPWHHVFATFESSYLEILLQFGIVGGACFAVVIGGALRNAWRFFMTSASCYRAAPLAILLSMLVAQISDTYLVLQNFSYGAILFSFYFGVRRYPVVAAAPAP